jgi:seryl-tRNA synthetase
MIDIRILRNDPDRVKENCVRRDCNVDLDSIRRNDQEYLDIVREVEDLRAQRNTLSKECGTNPAAREQVRAIKQTISEKESRQNELKQEIDEALSWLPNFLDESVPGGTTDGDNLELRVCGSKPDFGFSPLTHDEVADKLGILDIARGAKVAQSGFYYWVGKGAQLAQALFFWTQQELVKRGFTLMMTPCAAKAHTLYGTGYLPFFADQTYNLAGEDLALIGTSEQTLVGYHGNEVLKGDELPYCYTSFSPCFRTESGSYGKAVRGIFRVHQFHKVEQIIFCLPEDSPKYHDFCLENEEYLLQQLGLSYRVVNVCIGDLGAPGFKKYDIEAWFAGFGDYREVTSNTNLTEFQSRRLGIRYQNKDGERGFVHTISATAVTDRVVCAILENFQQEDGSVIIPEVLRPYTGFDKIEPPASK